MRCLLVEDQTILLDLLASVVESFPEITEVVKADCITSAEAQAFEIPLDLGILDLHLPDGEGSTLATRLLERHPQIQLIILSGSAQEFLCPPELRTAIRGVIDKSDALNALRHCLATLIQPAHEALTARQKQIYTLIGEGKTTKEIAQLLGSSPSTVETHRKAIAQHLNLSGAELIRAAALHQHIQSIQE